MTVEGLGMLAPGVNLCAQCGKVIEGRNSLAIYCGVPCRLEAQKKRRGERNRDEASKRKENQKCDHCGGSLQGNRCGSKYCSDQCRVKEWRRNQERRRRASD